MRRREAVAPDRPNILLVITDQQSATMLGCAGNRHLRTPAMDSLAASGMRFQRAYCCNPMCGPSRFSLMTGRLPSEIGVCNHDDSHIDSMPAHVKEHGLGWMLRRAGYETAYGGKFHFPKQLTPEDIGFETISTDERDGLADTAADFIAQERERPFFLVTSFINPHDICYMAIRDFAATPQEGFCEPQYAAVRVSASRAKAIALSHVRGSEFLDIRLIEGHTYRVRVIKKGRRIDVYVDANTGRVK